MTADPPVSALIDDNDAAWFGFVLRVAGKAVLRPVLVPELDCHI
jgi:hypothetical protein